MSSPLNPADIPIYSSATQLPGELWEALASRPPAQAAAATGAQWDGQAYILPMLGREYRVDPRARRVELVDDPGVDVGFEAGMVLVWTLGHSTASPPAGRLVAPRELKGAEGFFVGPHALPTAGLARAFGPRPEALLQAGARVGARAMDVAGAQAAVRFMALPRVEMGVIVWSGDEEFGPEAAIVVDAGAGAHLAPDGVWALCNLAARRLLEESDG